MTDARQRAIDNITEFCHSAHMLAYFRKLTALLLAVWLPLFSANALAASMVMEPMSSACHHAQQVADSHQHMQHMQLTSNYNPPTESHDQQSSTHNDCGVCQLACCGYMATVTFQLAEGQALALSYTPSSTQFQSFNSAPLDPPPLARV